MDRRSLMSTTDQQMGYKHLMNLFLFSQQQRPPIDTATRPSLVFSQQQRSRNPDSSALDTQRVHQRGCMEKNISIREFQSTAPASQNTPGRPHFSVPAPHQRSFQA